MRRPHNLEKYPTLFWNYICTLYRQNKVSNFLKFLWPSRNIWTLPQFAKVHVFFKSKVKISSNFVAFLENINFKNSTFLLYFIFSVGIKHTIFFCLGRCVCAKIFLRKLSKRSLHYIPYHTCLLQNFSTVKIDLYWIIG